jgi:thioredoxin reductase (NADPH)
VADYVDPSWAGSTWGLGGTCLNVGCIPKKLFHTAAIHREQHVLAAALGWDTKATHNWETMVENVNMYIKKQVWGHKTDLRSKKVTYLNSIAVFGEKTADGLFSIELYKGLPTKGGEFVEKVTTKKVLLATGGRPNDGGYKGANLTISSDDIFHKKTAPGKTLVVGASYIALECAGFINGLGFDTSVMIRSIPLRGFDQDIAERIKDFMADQGTNFVEKSVPTEFYEAAGGRIGVKAEGPSGAFDAGLFDTVLLAIGRTGCATHLRTDKVGLEVNKKKDKIIVDDSDATNVSGIYAIGDVAEGRPELTPVAIQAGKMLAHRLYGDSKALMDYKLVCTTVFTPIEYGCCGISEDEALKDGPHNNTIYYCLYTPLEWRPAAAEEENLANRCVMKVIVDSASDKVVGMHILGPNAGEILQGFGVAMQLGMTKPQLDNCVGIHPSSAEELTTLNLIKTEGEDMAAKAGC